NGAVSLSLAKLDLLTGERDVNLNSSLGSSGQVLALAEQPDGKLVVGGEFVFAGGLPRRNLARLDRDGSLDPFWAPDPDGPVLAVAVSGTNVFVGGTFSKIGGLDRARLARLSTFGRDAADPDWDPKIEGEGVYALAVAGTNLYVGGL